MKIDISENRAQQLDVSRDDDSLWDLQQCTAVLESLLENDNSDALAPKQLDAIRRLRSLAAASSNDVHAPETIEEKFESLTVTYRRTIGGRISETIHKAEQEDEGASHTYQDILDNYGAVIKGSVKFHSTKTNLTKEIQLRGTPSGNRINLLIENYKTGGARTLLQERLSTISSSTSDLQLDQYCPAEWKQLATETKTKLVDLLSWEHLSKWDFDIVELAGLSSDPLLLVGWALLCGPMAQKAMKRSISAEGGTNDEAEELVGNMTKSYHYNFHESMNINPKHICNFLREVEVRYKHDNPYHNNIHAADVTQTTHALFQLIDEQYIIRIYDKITIFSLLLAATFHDIGHPGTNNLFQQNAITRLAVEYNDVSVLENMHSAVGHSLLYHKEGCEVIEGWDQDDKVRSRNIMTKAILGTDMTNHFSQTEQLDSLVCLVSNLAEGISQDDIDCENGMHEPQPVLLILANTFDLTDENKECNHLKDLLMKFLLHAADISNPAKKEKLSLYWANCALSEFFSQGDKEKEMNLPVSPLCDREAVRRHDSQIGFIKFVIQPTFELLGKIIPRVKDEVMPMIENSLEYWSREKKRLSGINLNGQ